MVAVSTDAVVQVIALAVAIVLVLRRTVLAVNIHMRIVVAGRRHVQTTESQPVIGFFSIYARAASSQRLGISRAIVPSRRAITRSAVVVIVVAAVARKGMPRRIGHRRRSWMHWLPLHQHVRMIRVILHGGVGTGGNSNDSSLDAVPSCTN